MKTNTWQDEKAEAVNQKKREWIKQALEATEDEKAVEAFRQYYAEYSANMYHYSFSNTFWLMMQTIARGSFAFSFGSFQNWKKVKRFVKAGEKAMSVLVPVTVIIKDKDGKPVLDEKGQPRKRTYFNVKNGVFAIDQTGGEEMPSFRTIENFEESVFNCTFEKLSKLYPISYTVLAPSCGGFANKNGITLNSERNKASQFCTLIHETSHLVLGHLDEKVREDLTEDEREAEAELSTVVYCLMNGIPAKGSAHYLKDRINFDTLDIRHINRAIKGAGKIHEMVHGKKEVEEEKTA